MTKRGEAELREEDDVGEMEKGKEGETKETKEDRGIKKDWLQQRGEVALRQEEYA